MKHRAETVEATGPVGPASGKHLSGGGLDPADGADQEPVPAHLIPATATWKSRRLGRTLMTVVAVAAAVAVVPTAAYFWQMRTTARLEVFVGVALLAVGAWAVLSSRRTQTITLRGSLLTVSGPRTTDTFDLADTIQPVELTGTPRRGRWLLTLTRDDGSCVVLGRRDVDARQLDAIVRHFRDLAQRRRDQRWAMLGL